MKAMTKATLMPITRTMCLRIVLAILLTGASGSVFASTKYRVWYFNDFSDAYQHGDITNKKNILDPPAYACGLRIENPKYYYWANQYHTPQKSGNFGKDVVVWIPKSGCPYGNELVIAYHDGSKVFNWKPGWMYMEITTDYSHHWVDKDGERPIGTPCCAVDRIFTTEWRDWDRVIVSITELKSALNRSRHEAVEALLRDSEDYLYKLSNKLESDITMRRKYSVGDRETSVKSLENQASRKVRAAATQLGRCRGLAESNLTAEAYRSCDAARDSVSAAQSAWELAKDEIR